MLDRLFGLPFLVILTGIGALAMFVPAAHALAAEDGASARVFAASGGLVLLLTAFIAIATSSRETASQARSHLLALLGAFTLLPAVLAIPLYFGIRDTSFLNAYVEMVSSLTTTGATLFDDPGRLSSAAHLWRALVAWLGGFLVLLTAIAIMAPMNLGGFEVLNPLSTRRDQPLVADDTWRSDTSLRLERYAGRLFPPYLGLTVLLWFLLFVLGDGALVALIHAMSVISTSGISSIGGLQNAESGIAGEAAIFVFLFLALSRLAYAPEQGRARGKALLGDPEFRLGVAFLVAVPSLLFLRHWIGAVEVQAEGDIVSGALALWGGLFNVMSFLTTNGFESTAWDEAQSWSGLRTSGIILMGLALVGGGVATTAGGVKLLRIFALLKLGDRELRRLVYPSSIGGAGVAARQLRRQGAMIAWVFFMLFALSLAAVVIALTARGIGFEAAITLAIAALSTCGPVIALMPAEGFALAATADSVKLILAAAMVLGRLETLVIIALFNPDFWRS